MGRRPGSKGSVVSAQLSETRPAAPVGKALLRPHDLIRARIDGVSRSVQETTISSDTVEKRLLRRGLRPRWEGEPPSRFGRLTLDSRLVSSGDLFCAISGSRVDAHDYLADVAAAGVGAAVVERLRPDVRLPQLRVTDTRAAGAHLASLFADDPSASLRIAGITGTNGKTTTAWLARQLLGDLAPAAALGTLGMVGPNGERDPGALTTPDPIQLMERFAAMAAQGVERVAMEVSSHALDQRRVEALKFETVVFTSFSREHLEYHPDLAHYRSAKLRILELLEPGGVAVINADEPAWEVVLDAGVQTLTYGLSTAAEIRAVDVELGADRSSWRLVTPEGEARVDLPMAGEFNVGNALAAAALALTAGMVPTRIAELLSATPAVPGRMEVLRRAPSVVLRDYAHTPDAYDSVLASLEGATSGRLFVVFGCGGDRDRGKRPLMGQAAARHADLVLVTTDNPRSEDPAAIAGDVVAGMPEGRYEIVLDRREAIARALELAAGDDIVVLLGKGHETYQVIGDERVPFDEAEIVRELTAGDTP